MARVTIEDCLQNCPDQFALVHLASTRYRLLHKGANPLVEAPKNKLVVLSLREVAAGKVVFKENIPEMLLASRVKPVSERMRARAQGGVKSSSDF